MDKINIENAKKLVKENKMRWTNHIVMRLIQRNISQKDIQNAIMNGEIIENYEDDYPYPSCLICGINLANKIIHVVCGSNGNELWLITAYYPNELEWEKDLKTRRREK